ncbi:hypothetical protein PUN28_008227 [Cardiocondyla obscurior]|uniref:Ubiquitin-like protease family profile domain-containing protein n=1 Tax=Cardiocondyla obscurior TaxID=286306 RepID=A0AAW2FWP4_9HYME
MSVNQHKSIILSFVEKNNISKFLKDYRLFPTHDFEKKPVKFSTVQKQPNLNNCGVYATAFAVSLLFDIKPDKVRYEHSLMRLHLLNMFETNVIEHFPQDLQNGVLQKVLPLAVIIAREAEAIRLSIKRQCEKKCKKKQIQKTIPEDVGNVQQIKKELKNDVLLSKCVNNGPEYVQYSEINNKKK